MSLVRISTTGPEQTCSLWNLLAKRGLNVVILSATELGVECDEVSEDLSRELEWARAQVQSNVPTQATSPTDVSAASLEAQAFGNENASAENGGAQSGWMEDYVVEREFVLAPYWRRVKTAVARCLRGFSQGDGALASEPSLQNPKRQPAIWSGRLAATIGIARDAIKRAGQKLQDVERRILEKSDAGAFRRENAEASVWGTAESEAWPPPPETPGRFFNVKIFAFLGGATMAGLILMGLSLAHRSSAPLSTGSGKTSAAASNATHSAESPATAAASSQPAEPVSESAVAAKAPKPSPSKSVQSARNSRPVRQRSGKPARSAADDDREVITKYYSRNAPRVHRASYDGVKHYSDMN
jgi:hypothetical protein